MYKRIIVGYDGSEQAEDAVSLGALLAKATDADLALVGVFDAHPMLGAAGPGAPPPPPEADEGLRAEVLAEVTRAAEKVGAKAAALPSASAAHGLQRIAEEIEADLIVVGSGHHGRAGRILAGSVGERLLHGSPCAVAVAPRGYAADAAPVQTVGVGFDGRRESDLALRHAGTLAQEAGARVRLVAVLEPETVVYGRGAGMLDPDTIEAAVREQLEVALEQARGSLPEGVEADGTVVSGAASEILAEQDVDLMVVGSRGYGPVRTVLLGGVSAPLIRSASHPVIVVPRSAT